jgi:GntR family transcriptional regulator, transcriptional repressor for pyruvate dehydrogenase complex
VVIIEQRDFTLPSATGNVIRLSGRSDLKNVFGLEGSLAGKSHAVRVKVLSYLGFHEIRKGLRAMPRTKRDAPDTYRTMHVVNHVRSLIENGTLQPGDKIPPEREFARALKISRASLRTGIGYLAAMGVMKVRHGVGTFVADGPAEFSKASLSLLGVLHGFQPWQMFEARLILESSLAELAAERGKEEHNTSLAEEVAEMFSAMESPAEYLIHDLLFHRVISQASGNPILAALMETVTSAMYDERRKTVERSRNLRESAEMHREIYRAIRARKPLEARRLMEEHLRQAQTAQETEPSIDQQSNRAKVKRKRVTTEPVSRAS